MLYIAKMEYECVTGAPQILNKTLLCEVLINDERIVVDYNEDGKGYHYVGVPDGPNSYSLVCNDLDTKRQIGGGRLVYDGSITLEGSWYQEGWTGSWKIRLMGEKNPTK